MIVKKYAMWSMIVLILFLLVGCGSEQNEVIEEYKSEARYYYDQVDAILRNLDIIEKMDNSTNSIENVFFASTLNEALFRSICLENLISTSQYYSGLEICIEQIKNLYNTIPQNEEVDDIKEIIDEIDSKCNDLKKLLEDATEYDSNFTDRYYSDVEDIRAQANALYAYVDGTESAVHSIKTDKEVINKYAEELGNHEKELIEDDLLGSQSRPLCVGDSVEVSFIDNGAGRKNDSWYVATGRFTYKGNTDEAVNLNFELIDQEAGTGIVLGPKYGYAFTFKVVNEHLQQDYIPYEGGAYRSEDKNEYIAVLEGGNIDISVKIENDTSYLVISYAESTEENLNVSNLRSATEKILWIKVE